MDYIYLFRGKDHDGIVTKHFANTQGYYTYLEKRLFVSINEQPIFCTNCGTVTANPKDFATETLKFCPRCGHDTAIWGWNGAAKLEMKVPIIINASIKKSIEIVLMISSIAQKKGLQIEWYTLNEEGTPAPLVLK